MCSPTSTPADSRDFARMAQDTPDDSPADRIALLQPGSSVATALSEGESRPKHVQLLEVEDTHGPEGTQWRLVKLPLTTVRPFVFEQASALPTMDPAHASLLVFRSGC
jgi:hypothetical protein